MKQLFTRRNALTKGLLALTGMSVISKSGKAATLSKEEQNKAIVGRWFTNFWGNTAREVTSGYDSHYDKDVKMLDFVSPGGSMVATAQDVGIFLRALNVGSLLNKDEQAIYSFIYEYEHTGLLPGYQSIARYHKDIDAVVIQFVNTSGGDMWTISEIVYNRVIKILKR